MPTPTWSHLREDGTSLLIVLEGGVPVVRHWGADLGDLTVDDVRALSAAAGRTVTHSSVDRPRVLPLLPDPASGHPGTPSVTGLRPGGAATTSASFRSWSAEAQDGGVVLVGTDEESGLDNHTVIPGLYAAGEVACVSVHGANRLGTNSLLDINVFGRRAGVYAAEYAASTDFDEIVEERPEGRVVEMIEQMRDAGGSERVAAIRQELQATMDINAQVYRTEGSLKQALADLEGLKARYANVSVQDKGKRFNTDLLEAIELGFLLDLAEVLVTSALARNESRGGHFREDYPTRDDVNFMRHTMAYRNEDGSVRLDYKPVVETRYKPMERKY